MLATVVVEGFGAFSPSFKLISDLGKEGALWVAFGSAGELMRWSREFSHRPGDPPDTGLWWLEEAEFALSEGTSRIGFAQVGVGQDVHVAPLLVPLCQCFDESLRRLGDVDLRALQFNAKRLLPDRRPGDRPFIPELGWFRMAQGPRVNAFIAFDDGFIRRRSEQEFIETVQGWNSLGVFEFGTPVPGLTEHAIEDRIAWPADTALRPAERGIPVEMPEWTPASAAMALAWVIENARRDQAAASNFAIRITRFD